MIEIKNQCVSIDGEPVILKGAEFHYFRNDARNWESILNKIKACHINLVSTYIPWMWHEPIEGKIDLTGKRRPETNLAAFFQAVKDAGMYLLVRPGPYIMSETINSGVPMWVNEKYPEVISRKANGEFSPSQVANYLHPKFVELTTKWYQAVCQVIKQYSVENGGNIIMFQLDNEVGMLQWVTNQPDLSDEALDRFSLYLGEKFSTIEKLNKYLDLDLTQFSDVANYIKSPVERSCLKLHELFGYFLREDYANYIKSLKGLAIQNGCNMPFIVNVHGFDQHDYSKRGKQYPIGLSQLYEIRKIEGCLYAGDYYIGNIVPDNYYDVVLANEFTKAIQPKEQPLFSAEFQGGFQYGIPKLQPTTYDLKTRLCFANGMNAINYYMFVGGYNDEGIGLLAPRHDWQAPISSDGSLKIQYHYIHDLMKVFKAYESELIKTKPRHSVCLGFNPDYYMTEFDNQYTKPRKDMLVNYRNDFLYEGVGKAIVNQNIYPKGIDLLSSDLSKEKQLIVFSTEYMNQSIQLKLIEFIKSGGSLFIYPQIPTKDMNGEVCTYLKDYLDIEIVDKEWWKLTNILDYKEVNVAFTEHYQVNDDWKELGSNESSNYPHTCLKKIGKGQVLIFGCAMKNDYAYKDDIIKRLLEYIQVYPLSEVDEWVTINIREDKDTLLFFINNLDEYDKTICIKELANHPIHIPMRKGLILPKQMKITDEITILYSTLEIKEKKIEDKKCTIEFGSENKNGFVKLEILNPDLNISSIGFDLIKKNDQTILYKIKENSKNLTIIIG
ncbi:beta-galactosidase [Mycoplasmatota bacterium]|nr:beta-galactosidase [Mycoplasmatota bacterium]